MLTAVAAAGTLLYLMFSTGDEVVDRTGLFGAVSFETTRIADGGLGVEMGVASLPVLLALAALAAAMLVLVQVVYLALRNYRTHLIEQG